MPSPIERLTILYRRENAAQVIKQWYKAKKSTSAVGAATGGGGGAAASKPLAKTKPQQRTQLLKLHQPRGTDYLDYATKLRSGDYLRLATSTDPQDKFDTDLLEALNFLYTTRDEDHTDSFATVKLLRSAKQWCRTKTVTQFRWDDPTGPYKPEDIGYTDSRIINTLFLRELTSHPAHQQTYFTINLPSHFTTFIFYLFISNARNTTQYPQLSILLNTFIQQRAPGINAQLLLNNRDEFLYNCCEPYEIAFCQKPDEEDINDRESCEFLFDMLMDSNMPLVCGSPDFDTDNPRSPTLSLMIPTVTSWKILSRAAHGDHTIDPLFVIGEFGPKPVRGLIDDTSTNADILASLYRKPLRLADHSQLRLVELVHRLFHKQRKPHGFDCSDYILSVHDLFHTWMISALHKRLLHHLRTLFEKPGPCHPGTRFTPERTILMSSSIYQLSDMDFPFVNKFRCSNDIPQHEIQRQLLNFLKRLGFIAYPHCLSILLLNDMLRNPSLWADFFLLSSGDDFNNLMRAPAEGLYSYRLQFDISSMINEYKSFKAFLNEQDFTIDTPIELVILNYKLRGIPNAKLLCSLVNEAGLGKFFYWGINKGLFIRHELRSPRKVYGLKLTAEIDKMDKESLYFSLLDSLYQQSRDHYRRWLTQLTKVSIPILLFFAKNNLLLPLGHFSINLHTFIDWQELCRKNGFRMTNTGALKIKKITADLNRLRQFGRMPVSQLPDLSAVTFELIGGPRTTYLDEDDFAAWHHFPAHKRPKISNCLVDHHHFLTSDDLTLLASQTNNPPRLTDNANLAEEITLDSKHLNYLMQQTHLKALPRLTIAYIAAGTVIKQTQLCYLIKLKGGSWIGMDRVKLADDITDFSIETHKFLITTKLNQQEFFRYLARGALHEATALTQPAITRLITELEKDDLSTERLDLLCALVTRIIHRSKTDFADQQLDVINRYARINRAILTRNFSLLCRHVCNPDLRDHHWRSKTGLKFFSGTDDLSCYPKGIFWTIPNIVDQLTESGPESIRMQFVS